MGTPPSDRPRARHRTVAAAWARLALAAAVGAACERQRSAVLVRIETDLTAGTTGEVKGVRVRVAPGSGATSGWRLDTAYPIQVGARGSYELPLRVLVMPLEDDAARVVTVEAWVCDTPSCPTATQPLVEQRAIFSFVAGEQRELLMFLSDVCRGMRCDNPLETCRGRVPGCQPARVEASLLPVAGQGAPPLDATVRVDARDAALEGPEAGLCGGSACQAGEVCCVGRCVDVLRDPRQCGACDTPCGAEQTCVDGRCVCPRGKMACLGDCLNLDTDARNCGACGARCTGVSVCESARCQCLDRGNRERMCGDLCVALAYDTEHCGACGTQCVVGGRCVDGACQCPSLESLCGSACADLSRDAVHCGACGTDCGEGRACEVRMCVGRGVGPRPPSCPMESPICALRTIPAATFTLGADGVPDAGPPQPGISVDAFTIDAHEVTVARFRRYWAAGHSGAGGRALRYPGGAVLRLEGHVRPPVPTERIAACNWSVEAGLRETYPINCVDWVTAQSFCAWDDGRLPTEAEWELAARGPGGRPLPWGSAPPTDHACLSNGTLARSGTCPVDGASFMAGVTPEGVWNLIGNVAEYVADVPAAYSDARCWGGTARTNPLCLPGSTPATARTVRGHGWDSRGPYNAAARPTLSAAWDPTVGFRCARSFRAM